jgi:hypothetical protein
MARVWRDAGCSRDRARIEHGAYKPKGRMLVSFAAEGKEAV